ERWAWTRWSERTVPVLAPGPGLHLRERGLQRLDQHRARAARLDHVVDIAALCSRVRIREPFLVVRDQLVTTRVGVTRLFELPPEDDVHGPFRPHHGDLGRGPREVEVGADVLRAHD